MLSLFENLNSIEKLTLSISDYSNQVFKLIKEYSKVQNKEAQLNLILDKLESLDEILKSNGYTYDPSNLDNYDEEDFEDVLEMFGEFLRRYQGEVNVKEIEVFNTEVKQMISLIDRHLNGFVNENAITIKEE